MVKMRILLLGATFLLCLPASPGFAAHLYSCEMVGTSSTYTRAEVDEVISAGGKCHSLKATNTATCVIGNLVQRYAKSDVETVLQEYPDALCMRGGGLVAKANKL